MTVEQVDEQIDEQTDIEKKGAAKEYDPEYVKELLASVRPHFSDGVWNDLHQKARAKAGGIAAGKSRSAAASQSATTALSEPVDMPAAVGEQPPVAKDSEAKEEPDVEKQEMHPDCQKVADNCMKMKKSEEVDKAAHGKQDAPIADTGGWDAGAAQKRLLAWAGGPDKDKVNWQKFGKGFLYHDPANADNIGGYKFPVADIVGGQFKINRAGLAAAAGRINQSSGIPPNELASMKSTLRSYYNDIGEDAPDNIAKDETEMVEENKETKEVKEVVKESREIEPFTGTQPLVTFVAASPGVIESLRKEALVGPSGRIFNEQYLKPLEITRDDIAITYLIPRLLTDSAGKVREPTAAEIAKEQSWRTEQQARREAPNDSIVVALGHTVKGVLGSEVAVTLPHPVALGTPRTNQELLRKRGQLKKMVDAKLNYLEYGRLRKSLEKRR